MDKDLNDFAVGSARPKCLEGEAFGAPVKAAGKPDIQYLQLARIEEALHRVEAGTFGFCVACGGAITLSRLDLDPSEDHCQMCEASARHCASAHR